MPRLKGWRDAETAGSKVKTPWRPYPPPPRAHGPTPLLHPRAHKSVRRTSTCCWWRGRSPGAALAGCGWAGGCCSCCEGACVGGRGRPSGSSRPQRPLPNHAGQHLVSRCALPVAALAGPLPTSPALGPHCAQQSSISPACFAALGGLWRHAAPADAWARASLHTAPSVSRSLRRPQPQAAPPRGRLPQPVALTAAAAATRRHNKAKHTRHRSGAGLLAAPVTHVLMPFPQLHGRKLACSPARKMLGGDACRPL